MFFFPILEAFFKVFQGYQVAIIGTQHTFPDRRNAIMECVEKDQKFINFNYLYMVATTFWFSNSRTFQDFPGRNLYFSRTLKMEIPGHFRTNYKKIMKFQDIPGQKDKKKIQYHFSLKNKKAHIPGGSRKILDFGPSKLLEITFSALIFSTCRCTLDAILKFTCLKWLKMSSNSPPWLEKILKFTCLKWLKMSSNSPPWYLNQVTKFRMNQ